MSMSSKLKRFLEMEKKRKGKAKSGKKKAKRRTPPRTSTGRFRKKK